MKLYGHPWTLADCYCPPQWLDGTDCPHYPPNVMQALHSVTRQGILGQIVDQFAAILTEQPVGLAGALMRAGLTSLVWPGSGQRRVPLRGSDRAFTMAVSPSTTRSS